MNIEKLLKVLKTNRRVDNEWIQKLENHGFVICYNKYIYWDNEPYIQFGSAKIWLVEEYSCGNNSTSCGFRLRNEVVKEVLEEIENQYNKIKEEEILEGLMFNK